MGMALISLAVWELTVVLLANSLLTKLCFIVYPGLRVICEFPRREILQAFWSYSSWVFIINGKCQQFIYYTDNLVVGAFLSVSAVTFYTIGGTLAEYSRQMVTSLTVTFTPLASSFEAEGRSKTFAKLLIQGTRAALLIGLPCFTGAYVPWKNFHCFMDGRTVRRYIQPRLANPVGRLCQVSCIGNATAGGIAYGTEKHDRLAYFIVIEGLMNLTLSILLVRHIGLNGVAWGTTIPSLTRTMS